MKQIIWNISYLKIKKNKNKNYLEYEIFSNVQLFWKLLKQNSSKGQSKFNNTWMQSRI